MQYTGTWVIDHRGVTDVVRLHDISYELGYILWHDNITTADGFSALRIHVEVPSARDFTRFVREAEPLLVRLCLTDWRRVPEKYERQHIFDRQIRLSQLSDSLLRVILRSFEASAQYNDDLRALRMASASIRATRPDAKQAVSAV